MKKKQLNYRAIIVDAIQRYKQIAEKMKGNR